MARADPRPLPQARRPLTPGAVRREAVRSADVLVGAAATAVRVGVGVGRIALLPARLVARSPLVAPAVRAGTETLAAAGREAEARGLRRLEQAETGAVDLVAHRVLESPQLETLLREAAKSPAAQALVDDVVRSSELQRAMEEVLSGPAVRAAMTRQTRTLGTEVATGVRGAAERLDERLARAAARVLRRPAVSAPGYAGLASRGAAFAVDFAVTQGAALLLA